MSEILYWVLILISVPLIWLLVRHTIKRSREVSERIRRYHDEQEAQKQQPGPINPYADMAQAFGVPPDFEDKERKKKQW